jgi:hypothetical protein
MLIQMIWLAALVQTNFQNLEGRFPTAPAVTVAAHLQTGF